MNIGKIWRFCALLILEANVFRMRQMRSKILLIIRQILVYVDIPVSGMTVVIVYVSLLIRVHCVTSKSAQIRVPNAHFRHGGRISHQNWRCFPITHTKSSFGMQSLLQRVRVFYGVFTARTRASTAIMASIFHGYSAQR